MARTKQEVQAFLRELGIKVKNGAISKDEATKLAVLAVSEVAPTQPEPPAKEGKAADEQTEKPEAKPAAKPQQPSVDPKNQLVTLLNALEQSFGASIQEFQKKVDAIIRGTEGAAVPLGDYTISKGARLDDNVKLSVNQVDQSNVEVTYTTRRKWKLGGLTLPAGGAEKAEASVEPSCHLPLRKEVLAIADDIIEHSDSTLSWKRFKLPVTAILNARDGANKENDTRLGEILGSIPSGDDFQTAAAWNTWANAVQVMLLGNDYASEKSFNQIVAEVKG